MTELQFQSLCGKLLIDPAIALENKQVITCLKNKDDKGVEEALTNEF